MKPGEIEVKCPLCAQYISIPITITPMLMHNSQFEVMVGADVETGVAKHDCPKVGNKHD